MTRATSIGMSICSARHVPYAVMDTGAERRVICGVGWHIQVLRGKLFAESVGIYYTGGIFKFRV